jgi:hypothetical protein
MDSSEKLAQVLSVSRQLVEKFEANLAKTERVLEDSRRLIEQSRITLEKAKRLVKWAAFTVPSLFQRIYESRHANLPIKSSGLLIASSAWTTFFKIWSFTQQLILSLASRVQQYIEDVKSTIPLQRPWPLLVKSLTTIFLLIVIAASIKKSPES